MITDQDLKKQIEAYFNASVKSISPMSSAKHAEIFSVMMDNGDSYVAKKSSDDLDEEAKMLNFLHEKGGMPTPRIYKVSPQFMIQEYVYSDWQMNESAQIDAALHLARLHQVEGEAYGFHYDTHLASITQSNAKKSDWAEFFIQNRIIHMAELAYRKGYIDPDMMHKIDVFCSRLAGIIKTGNPPVLIHGDCWGGNILPYQGKIKAFIDPAIYYADHEIELAFMSLFNTADQHFYAHYQHILPIKPGFFEERRLVYQCYPLLVHTVLFGRSYVRKLNAIIDKFI